MTLEDHLHDEIDALEDLRDKAREIVKNVAKDVLDQAFKNLPDAEQAFSAVAHEVEADLAQLTTEAVKRMAKLAKNRPSE